MELSEKVKAVGRMQRYIMEHLDEDISLDDIAGASGYSKYYAMRIFKELTGRTVFETIRALRLTRAAHDLQSFEKVVDVAICNGFGSHDGFTRAFHRQFGITPQKYRAELPPINLFIQYPIEAYYMLKEGGKERMSGEKVSRTVTVTVVERPARKLIFLRHNGTDYFSGCEEMGCEWEGGLKQHP